MYPSGSFKISFVMDWMGGIVMDQVSKTQNEPERWTGNDAEWHIQNVPDVPTMVHHFQQKSGKLQENCRDISKKLKNPVHFECPCSFPAVSQIFAESGVPWSEHQVHSECATQHHFQSIVLVRFQFY